MNKYSKDDFKNMLNNTMRDIEKKTSTEELDKLKEDSIALSSGAEGMGIIGKVYYDGMVKAGFTEDQSLTIVSNILIGVFFNINQ